MSEGTNPTPWVAPGKWTVCLHDFEPEVRKEWHLPARVRVHDVTLRDGEQWPGVVFTRDEKLRIAHALADLGVDRIEGGMASVSQEDADAITAMSREIKTAEICAFTRARRDDVELAIKCGVRRLIVEVPALRAQLARIWGTPEKAAEQFVGLADFAAGYGVKVTLFLMEASRADVDFLKRIIVPSVKQAKIDSIGLVDTRGSALPQAMAWLVSTIKPVVGNLPIEVHVHDIWGMATATTLAAVAAGAEVIHGAVNGLNGNAALEECVMGVHALLGVETGMNTQGFTALSKLVREASGVDWYKPFVGPLVNAVEVGITTQMMWDRRDEPNYGRGDLLNFELLGAKAYEVVMGKKSGASSVLLKARDLGLPEPDRATAGKILSEVKALSMREKRAVSDDEFRMIYDSIAEPVQR
jgi:methanogen homocitrate synthase